MLRDAEKIREATERRGSKAGTPAKQYMYAHNAVNYCRKLLCTLSPKHIASTSSMMLPGDADPETPGVLLSTPWASHHSRRPEQR